jgi:hypothetical protein
MTKNNGIILVEFILIITLILGLGFIYYGKIVWSWDNYLINFFIPSILTIFITTIAIGLLYELLLRKKYLLEAINLSRYAHSLNLAGIKEYNIDFEKIDFENFFNNTKKIDVVFIYGGTWIEKNQRYLLYLFKSEIDINICLTNPESNYIDCLEKNWYDPDTGKYSKDYIKNKINESLSKIKELYNIACKDSTTKRANLTIYLSDRDAPYSFYRADDSMIFVPKKKCKEKSFDVRYLLVAKSETGKGLFEWVLEDYNNTKKDGGIKKHFP